MSSPDPFFNHGRCGIAFRRHSGELTTEDTESTEDEVWKESERSGERLPLAARRVSIANQLTEL